MGIVSNQGSRNLLWVTAGLLLGYLNLGFLFPRYFTPEEIGLTRTVLSLGTLVAAGTKLGQNQVINRFFPYAQHEGAPGLLTFSLTVIGLAFAGVSLLVLLFQEALVSVFADSSPRVAKYFLLLLPVGLMSALTDVLGAYSRALFRTVTPLFLNEIGIRALNTLLIGVFALGAMDYPTFFVLFIAIQAIPVVGIWLDLRRQGLRLRWHPRYFRSRWRNAFLHYGLFSVFLNLNFILSNRVDILMIGAMLSQREVGIYAVAALIGQVVQLPMKSIKPILTPSVARQMRRRDWKAVGESHQKAALMAVLLCGLVFALVWGNLSMIFRLFKPEYSQALGVVLFIGLSKMVLNSSGTTGPILLNSRFYRYFMWLNLGKAALMVVSNLMLIPKLGIVGAALGTFITSLVGEVYSAGLIWRRLKLQPISKQWAMALGLVGGLTAFNALLPAPDARVWLVLGGKVLFTLLFFVAFVVWGRISPDLIGIFNQWLGIIGIRLPGEEASKPGPAGKTKDQTHA